MSGIAPPFRRSKKDVYESLVQLIDVVTGERSVFARPCRPPDFYAAASGAWQACDLENAPRWKKFLL
jgi:hypothetical protein